MTRSTVTTRPIGSSSSGRPAANEGPGAIAATAPAVVVETPPDIVSLRGTNPELARSWRSRVRDELGGRLAEGWQIVGVTSEGGYGVSPPSS